MARATKKFNERIDIFECKNTTDENGMVSTENKKILTSPAYVRDFRAHELSGNSAYAESPTGSKLCVIRHDYKSDIEFSNNMRVEWRGNTYKILNTLFKELDNEVEFFIARLANENN